MGIEHFSFDTYRSRSMLKMKEKNAIDVVIDERDE